MNERIKILNDLLNFNNSLKKLEKKVKGLNWDYEGAPVIVNRSHLKAMLIRFLKGELKIDEVEDWANLIECREDITFEPDYSDELSQIIYQLANPILEGVLSYERCKELIRFLDDNNKKSSENN